MLTVEMTLMPAASSSSMSCQRFSLRLPGTFVWASSSTSASCGWRASTASMSISSNCVTAVGRACARGMTSRSRICAAVAGRPWVST